MVRKRRVIRDAPKMDSIRLKDQIEESEEVTGRTEERTLLSHLGLYMNVQHGRLYVKLALKMQARLSNHQDFFSLYAGVAAIIQIAPSKTTRQVDIRPRTRV
jgi:hypothetical protein